MNWLEENSLKEVRIGLNSHGSGLLEGQIPTAVDTYDESAVFAKGFRFEKLEGCKLTLRNEGFDLISFGTKYPDPRRGSLEDYRTGDWDKTTYAGELLIPLDRIIAKKLSFRHTKKTESAALLGTWRTHFNKKASFFLFPTNKAINSVAESIIRMELVDKEKHETKDYMDGYQLTFTFDDKEACEKFYSAISMAIDSCRKK